MNEASSTGKLIARLEQELKALWTEPDAPDAPPKSRVCTMNLEVVAGSKELLDRYTPVVDEVAASVQARAILASIEPTSRATTSSASAPRCARSRAAHESARSASC